MPRVGFRQLIRGFDLGLLTITVILVLFGLAALYSFSLNSTTVEPLLLKQVLFALAGLALIFIFTRVDYRLLGGIHWILYGLGLALLAAVLFFGSTQRGTTGWFELGLFQFQPVELMKVLLAITLAKYLSDHRQDQPARLLLISGVITAVPVGLVVIQPDFGSAVMLAMIWLVLLVAVPIPRRYLWWLTVVGLIVVAGAWFFLLQGYQQERILNVINPSRDPLGTGYNVRQAITAIGAGQIFGRGLGLGTQSQLHFLPERQTDFIFASIAEEFGLVGSLAIVVLFGLLFWRLILLARRVPDNYSFYLILALGGSIFFQTAINILMNLGLFPVTGLPLPFLSYGGSSLLVSMMAVGIMESIVLRQRTAPL